MLLHVHKAFLRDWQRLKEVGSSHSFAFTNASSVSRPWPSWQRIVREWQIFFQSKVRLATLIALDETRLKPIKSDLPHIVINGHAKCALTVQSEDGLMAVAKNKISNLASLFQPPGARQDKSHYSNMYKRRNRTQPFWVHSTLDESFDRWFA